MRAFSVNEPMQAPPPEQRIFRDKLAREMSFSLGYEVLESAFGDLPQWTRCEFWFQARPSYWASDFAATLTAAEPYPIACATPFVPVWLLDLRLSRHPRSQEHRLRELRFIRRRRFPGVHHRRTSRTELPRPSCRIL